MEVVVVEEGEVITSIFSRIRSHERCFQGVIWAVVVAGMVMEVGVGVDGGALKGHSGNTQAARLLKFGCS